MQVREEEIDATGFHSEPDFFALSPGWPVLFNGPCDPPGGLPHGQPRTQTAPRHPEDTWDTQLGAPWAPRAARKRQEAKIPGDPKSLMEPDFLPSLRGGRFCSTGPATPLAASRMANPVLKMLPGTQRTRGTHSSVPPGPPGPPRTVRKRQEAKIRKVVIAEKWKIPQKMVKKLKSL